MLNLIERCRSYPITLEDLKDHLVIEGTDQDARLLRLLAAATEYVEHECNRAFVGQTWKLSVPYFPRCGIELPRPPLTEIEWVKYFNDENILTTLDPSEYRVIAPSFQPAHIEPVTCWPATYQRGDAVQVQFQAGYQEVPDNCESGVEPDTFAPELVKHAIRILCGAWNENREAELTGTISKQMELGLDRILGHLQTGGYY